MPRAHIKVYPFALVIVVRETEAGKQYCLVQETKKHGELWWLPGGGVDPTESFVQGAVREVKEEAGIDIQVTGILRVEHSPAREPGGFDRMRMIFLARQIGTAPLKSTPDDETLQAHWVSLADLDKYEKVMRGPEPRIWFTYVEKKGPVMPIEFLGREGSNIPLMP